MVGLPSKKLEKLALGYVRRISAVSGTVLSASGGDPDVASPFLSVPAAYCCRYPDARWMFLTLTVRNCAIGELGETLNRMNMAFQRLEGSQEFQPVQGWIRTPRKLLVAVMVGASPFSHSDDGSPFDASRRAYVEHYRWVELWRDCLRVDYDPNVDVRSVKPRKPKDGESLACATALNLFAALWLRR